MEKSITKPVYPGMDVGKFLCAFLILFFFFHYFSEKGALSGLLDEAFSLHAIAAALFMTFSGFLLYNKLFQIECRKDRWDIVKKQTWRIYRIYFLWSIPYLIFSVLCWDRGSIYSAFILWEIQKWVFSSTFYTICSMPALAIGTVLTFWLTKRLPSVVAALLSTLCWISLVPFQVPTNSLVVVSQNSSDLLDFSIFGFVGSKGWLWYAFPLLLVGKSMVSCKNKVKVKSAIFHSLYLRLLLVNRSVVDTKNCRSPYWNRLSVHDGLYRLLRVGLSDFYSTV